MINALYFIVLVPVLQVCVGIISASDLFCISLLASCVQEQEEVSNAEIIIALIGEPGSGSSCHREVLAGTKTTR